MIRPSVIFFAIFLLTVVTVTAYDCPQPGQTTCRPCLRPDPDPKKVVENKSPSVVSLDLDKVDVRLPSPEGTPPKYPSYSGEMSIKIRTTASDPESDPLTYSYTVTGGRIVGTGSNVFWDLNAVWPGTYTITAAVDDGCGLCGAKITKSITVLPATETPQCVCPEIRIDHLNPKLEGVRDPTFSAYVSGPQPPDLKYNWSVVDGTITYGQGTRTVKLQASDVHSDRSVTLTLEISSEFLTDCKCPTTVTKTFKY